MGETPGMARLHLFELEDQPWFPAVVRDAGTAYLRFAVGLSGQARNLVPKLRETIERAGSTRIVDLCSGGAGPLPVLADELAEQRLDVRITLTDYYPNVEGFKRLQAQSKGRVDFAPEPIDARKVPEHLVGLRTMFSALHHFKPAEARAILQSAVDAGQPFAAFEVVNRHPFTLIMMALVALPVMLSVPFLRPFRWSWILFTYLIPIIPLFVMWDGFVSCLRVYSKDELQEMIDSLEGGDRFDWEIGDIAMPPAPVPAVYLIGVPRCEKTGKGGTA